MSEKTEEGQTLPLTPQGIFNVFGTTEMEGGKKIWDAKGYVGKDRKQAPLLLDSW